MISEGSPKEDHTPCVNHSKGALPKWMWKKESFNISRNQS